MLTDYFYPHVGGVEKILLDLCLRLVSNGHEVCVFTLNIPRTKDVEIFKGIKIIRANAIELTRLTGLQSAVSIKAWFKMRETIRDFNPDIIHAHHQLFFTTLIGMLLKKQFHIRTITTLHLGSIDTITGIKGRVIKAIEKKMGRIINNNSNLVTALSNNIREHGIKIGIDSKKFQVIPNAVDISYFKMPRSYSMKPRKVVFIGRLISTKGPQILIEAARLVTKKIPDVKFFIIGDGPLRKKLEKSAKENNLSKNVIFLGKVADIRNMMKESDVYVRPSIMDGMPIGILEAQAAGLPVIATNVAGTPEIIIHGKTGHLVKSGDAIELANAILDLLSNQNYLENIAQNGLNLVTSKFDWDNIYKSYETCYQKLLTTKIDFEG